MVFSDSFLLFITLFFPIMENEGRGEEGKVRGRNDDDDDDDSNCSL